MKSFNRSRQTNERHELSTAESRQVTSLSREEWNFAGLDEQEESLAFYYEYGRASTLVKGEVEKVRAARKAQVWHYWPWQHYLGDVICWAAQQEGFPNEPWLTWKRRVIEAIQSSRIENTELLIQKLKSSLQSEGMRKWARSPITTLDFLAHAVRGSNIDLRPHGPSARHVWHGDVKALRAWWEREARTFIPPVHSVITPCPEGSTFEFGVDWRLTDGEIIKAISHVIENARPKQFKQFAATRRTMRGFNSVLPVSKGTALKYLSVYRRRNSVKTWRQYLERYESTKIVQAKGGIKKASVISSKDIAQLTKHDSEYYRRAKLILDWFDKGIPLDTNDFE